MHKTRRPGAGAAWSAKLLVLVLAAMAARGPLAQNPSGPGPPARPFMWEPWPANQARETHIPRPQPALGSMPYVTLLLRFADTAGSTPAPVSYYRALMGDEPPGVAHYFREVSSGQFDLTGSRVLGWYNLPRPQSAYLAPNVPPGSQIEFQRVLNDAAAVADPDVHFLEYAGINLVFNVSTDGFWGFPISLRADGQTRPYHVTWVGANVTQHLMARMMGHSLGLPTSAGPLGQSSRWDLMRDGGGPGLYGWVAASPIAYHKNLAGWIPPERRYVAVPGTEQTIFLDRLNLPTQPHAHLMAQIPVFGLPDLFFTVEARRKAGYDRTIPYEGIVIHQVDPLRWANAPALVVDGDGNGNVNDPGAVWTPGETFVDPLHKLQVRVDAAVDTGYVVTIRNDGTVPPDHGLIATYYNSPDFTGDSITRIDPAVYFDWGPAAPHPTIRDDYFSVRWTGFVEPQFSETYTFFTQTDDGVRLWVNGQLLIDQWRIQGQTEYRGSIRLEAGGRYPIRVEFYEAYGWAIAKLLWSSPSTPKSVIPPDRLRLASTRKQQ